MRIVFQSLLLAAIASTSSLGASPATVDDALASFEEANIEVSLRFVDQPLENVLRAIATASGLDRASGTSASTAACTMRTWR